MRRLPLILSIGLTLGLALVACQKEKDKGAGTSSHSGPAAGAAKLEMYVMSECPYGVQVEQAIEPVRKQLGNALDLHISYIGSGKAGSFESLHGPTEVKGDIVQLCAAKQAPDKYFDLIACQNKNPRAVDTNWKDCATQAGIDADALGKCADSDEGQGLLADSFAASDKAGATGSPTIFLNGAKYEGGRKSRDLLKALCEKLPGDKPEPCKNIPVPPKVAGIFLSDKRCKECDIAPLEPRLKGIVGGLEVEQLDYMSDAGKKLYGELQAQSKDFKYLPAVLLSADVEKDTDAMPELQRYMQTIGTWRSLAIGGKFDPTAEICDNKGDDNGDGKVDCDDPTCKEQLVCRPVKPNQVDLFVMSHCPYGAKALVATEEVADHFGKELAINVHYIGDAQGDNLQSMHGPSEVDDDIRERCAIEHYGKNEQFMKYLGCFSKDVKTTDWKACVKAGGMDEKVIQTCFDDGSGKKLLAGDFAFSKALNMEASPTFLANNHRTFNAIAAADIQREVCTDNPGLAGCKQQMAGDAPGAAPPAGACK